MNITIVGGIVYPWAYMLSRRATLDGCTFKKPKHAQRKFEIKIILERRMHPLQRAVYSRSFNFFKEFLDKIVELKYLAGQ